MPTKIEGIKNETPRRKQRGILIEKYLFAPRSGELIRVFSGLENIKEILCV